MTVTWVEYSGRARVQDAYDTLKALLTGEGADPVAAGAWAVLDGAARGGELPAEWERMTSIDVAGWLGMQANHWRVLVATGYAPSADGADGARRSWWHPATVENFRAGRWEPTDEERARRPLAVGRAPGTAPPVSGNGSSAKVWREYLEFRGVSAPQGANRATLVEIARRRGLLNKRSA